MSSRTHMPPHKRVFPYGDRLGKTSTLLLDKAAIVGRGTCGQGRGERRRRAVSSTGLRPSHGHFRRPRSANSMRLRSCGLRLSKAAGPRPSERRPYDVWHVTACLGVETTRSRASAYKTDVIPRLRWAAGPMPSTRRRPAEQAAADVGRPTSRFWSCIQDHGGGKGLKPILQSERATYKAYAA